MKSMSRLAIARLTLPDYATNFVRQLFQMSLIQMQILNIFHFVVGFAIEIIKFVYLWFKR